MEELSKIITVKYSSFKEANEKLISRIDKLPDVFRIQYHHHLEPKSKASIVTWIVLLFFSMLGFSWGIAGYMDNLSFNADRVKYRMLKQQSPVLSRKIDSIYYNGPDQAEKDINKLESYLENLRNAERAAREKREDAVKAAREASEIKKMGSSTE
jgi:hypothetical protein